MPEGRLRRRAQRPRVYMAVAALAVLMLVAGIAGLGASLTL